MTAPALVMVAHGSADPSVAQVAHHLRQRLRELRPEIPTYCAFLDQNPPSLPQIFDQVAATGIQEIAVVPMQITHAMGTSFPIEELLQKARTRYPDQRFTLGRPLGPELGLLTVLDQRLRTALSHARCLELDGLVLSSPCTGDVRGAALLARRARQWSTHHKLPCQIAVGDDAGPSVAQAIMGLRAQGRRHIAVGSFFLAVDEAYHTQSDLAFRFGAITVSEPIGASQEVIDLVLARYAFAAMDLLDFGLPEEDEEPAPQVAAHLEVVSA